MKRKSILVPNKTIVCIRNWAKQLKTVNINQRNKTLAPKWLLAPTFVQCNTVQLLVIISKKNRR